MRPSAPRPPRPAGSPSLCVSSGSNGSYHCEREHSPRTPVAPPTPPSPSSPASDDEPSVERIDPEAELEGDPEEPYLVGDDYPGGYDVYISDASYGSEQESASVGSGPSSHHSSGSSSGSASIGYGCVTSGSASDGSSDDDLVNWYFARTFPPP
ncbi:hypothetical protein PIB30_044689 [Stylosanthes scabra]|uniref:Uncharacterized protein n=1 Tax=Stylosanthes scabra TaxID=79078 RepID=A0ABU6RG44_9FABA|nr:hypothetical protein [Stylosanthes scabra]